MKAIKSNMRDYILDGDTRILLCPNCLIEFSGNAGDYFYLPDDYVFKCPECGEDMELVHKTVKIIYEG
jgi:transcription initiation factor IIE alpha subunit